MFLKDPPVQITDDLWMLGTNEYPLYLVRGEAEAAIFEGGVGAMGPLVVEQLEKLAVDRGSVRQVVIPHAHPDHVMGVPLLRERLPAVTVLASEAAAGTLAHEKAISFFLQIDEALTASLMKAGLIAERHRPKPLLEKRIAVDRVVKEGETIAVDGLCFRVLHTPGHSDGSLSFHEPGKRILLVSDAAGYYMPESDEWWPDYFTGYEAYLQSIERLAALEAEILCLGHNGAVKGAEAVREHFRRSTAATQEYHRRIVDEARSGKPVRQIAERLGSEVYQKKPLLPLEFFQKNCNLLAKQSLKHEGIDPEKR
jgi:glyoxylase-like metal-dependent hydrolase (beta-lactamase superfamily II)